MGRDYSYQEEIKILMSEVFRNGDETDAEWTARYELLKQRTPLEKMGQMMALVQQMGYSLEEAAKMVKQLLAEAKRKNDISS